MEDMKMNPKLGEIAVKVKEADAAAIQTISPTAKTMFTPNALNKLVDAWNALAKAFGIRDSYPVFKEAVKQLPVDFVSQLLMVSKAVEDAIKAKATDPSLSISLDIRDDQGLVMLAAKLMSLAKSPTFTSFLQGQEEEVAAETETETEETEMEEPEEKPLMSDNELMNLLATKVRR